MDVDVVNPADGQLHKIPVDKFVDAWEEKYMKALQEKKTQNRAVVNKERNIVIIK